MDDLPGEDCYPGGVTAKMIDESQGEYDEPGWDPYDVPDEDWADEKYDTRSDDDE